MLKLLSHTFEKSPNFAVIRTHFPRFAGGLGMTIII